MEDRFCFIKLLRKHKTKKPNDNSYLIRRHTNQQYEETKMSDLKKRVGELKEKVDNLEKVVKSMQNDILLEDLHETDLLGQLCFCIEDSIRKFVGVKGTLKRILKWNKQSQLSPTQQKKFDMLQSKYDLSALGDVIEDLKAARLAPAHPTRGWRNNVSSEVQLRNALMTQFVEPGEMVEADIDLLLLVRKDLKEQLVSL